VALTRSDAVDPKARCSTTWQQGEKTMQANSRAEAIEWATRVPVAQLPDSGA